MNIDFETTYTLIISKDECSDTLTQTIAITNVTPAMGTTLVSPDSSFQSVVIIPLDIEGAKEDNVFNWSFGDGGSSSYSMPTYIYKEKGDYRLAARITDINDKTGIYIKNINVNNKYPKLVQSIKDRNLINSGESNQFFSSDLFVISSPKMRIYNPNTFPTIVFTIHNYTDKATDVNFNLLFPDGWEIIALTKPDVLRPNSTETYCNQCNSAFEDCYKILVDAITSEMIAYRRLVLIKNTIQTKLHHALEHYVQYSK